MTTTPETSVGPTRPRLEATGLSPRATMAAHALASIEATRLAGNMTATEARLAAADTLNGLSIDDRHAARMESRRLLALVSA